MAKKYDDNIGDKYYDDFPTNLRNTIKSRGYTQASFSDKLSISRQAVNQYCNGVSNANSESLTEMAKVLNVSVDFLLGLRKVESPDFSVQKINELLGLSEMSISLLSMWNEHSPNTENSIIGVIDMLIKSPDTSIWKNELSKLFSLAKERNIALLEHEKNPPSSEDADENGYIENIEYYSNYTFLQSQFEIAMWRVEQEFHKALENICNNL